MAASREVGGFTISSLGMLPLFWVVSPEELKPCELRLLEFLAIDGEGWARAATLRKDKRGFTKILNYVMIKSLWGLYTRVPSI